MSAGCLQQGPSLEPYELTHSFPVGIEGRWGWKWSWSWSLNLQTVAPRWMYHCYREHYINTLNLSGTSYEQFEIHTPREAGGEDPTKSVPK